MFEGARRDAQNQFGPTLLETVRESGWLGAVWVTGAFGVLISAVLPWAHLTVPLLGTEIWTGLDVTGWLLPGLVVTTAACAGLEISGRSSTISAWIGAGAAALALMLTAYGELSPALAFLGILHEMASPDALVRAIARTTSFGLDIGFFLALAGSLAAAAASTVCAIRGRC